MTYKLSGDTTPDSEVPCGKSSKRSGPDGEAHNSLTVITVDSPERASDALSTLDSASQEAPREPCASLEDGVPNGGPPTANKVVGEAPLEIVAEISFLARLENATHRRLKGPGRLVLNLPIILMK